MLVCTFSKKPNSNPGPDLSVLARLESWHGRLTTNPGTTDQWQEFPWEGASFSKSTQMGNNRTGISLVFVPTRILSLLLHPTPYVGACLYSQAKHIIHRKALGTSFMKKIYLNYLPEWLLFLIFSSLFGVFSASSPTPSQQVKSLEIPTKTVNSPK
jgi:hypothetical protein